MGGKSRRKIPFTFGLEVVLNHEKKKMKKYLHKQNILMGSQNNKNTILTLRQNPEKITKRQRYIAASQETV